jgi:catecholate siderophore receptor
MPQLQAVVGVRYDNFDVDFRDNRTGSRFSSSDDLVSPRAGLIYKPVEPMSVYVSYSVSYLPRAGAQLSSLSLTNQALDPEEYENYEIGAKWDFRDDLAVTAAVFRLDRENVAVTGLTPGSLILVDGQRSEGLELGLSGKLTEAWSLTGGYAYQDAKITRAQSATTPAGAELAQVPEHAFSLWNKYELTPMWGVGLGIIHQTDMFTSTNVATRTTLPDFTRVDGAVFFNLNQRWRAQVNVENIFDETYYANAHNDNNITPGSPRSLRASVTATF